MVQQLRDVPFPIGAILHVFDGLLKMEKNYVGEKTFVYVTRFRKSFFVVILDVKFMCPFSLNLTQRKLTDIYTTVKNCNKC